MWIWIGNWGKLLWFDGVGTQGVLFGNTLCDVYILIYLPLCYMYFGSS